MANDREIHCGPREDYRQLQGTSVNNLMRPWPPVWLQILIALWFGASAIALALAMVR